jgi:hypothetical protein
MAATRFFMQLNNSLRQQPQRVALHNEIHARPPEAMNAPLAISPGVMASDAAQPYSNRL